MSLVPDSPPYREAMDTMIQSVNLAYSTFIAEHPDFKVFNRAGVMFCHAASCAWFVPLPSSLMRSKFAALITY